MSTSENKITFGLKNVWLAPCTETLASDGTYSYTYETPVHLPGAKSLTLDANVESETYYFDDVEYYKVTDDHGYTGSLEVARITDDIRKAFLKEKQDTTNGIAYELADDSEYPYFALMFEFSGDVKAVRHAFYLCRFSKPSLSSTTKESSTEPGTESMDIEALPRKNDKLVKGRTLPDSTAYDKWYTTVQIPTM